MNLIHIVCVMFLCLHSLDNHRKRFGGSWFDMRLRYSCCLKSMYISNIYIYVCFSCRLAAGNTTFDERNPAPTEIYMKPYPLS